MSYHEDSEATSTAGATAVMCFALGAFAGAAVALLTAPASGRETRSLLKRRSRKLADDVRARGQETWNQQSWRVNDVVDRGYEQAAAVGDRLSDAVEQGKAAYRDVKSRAQQFVGDVRQEAASSTTR